MTHSKFPGLRWDADGVAHHCETEDDMQPGWADHPAKAQKVAPDESMTRQDIIAALDEGGIVYKKNAPTDALAKQLRVAVLSVLEENDVKYAPNASTKDLLALIPQPE